MIQNRSSLIALVVMLTAPPAAYANVVTDWDEIAVKTIQPPGPVPPISVDLTFRAAALVEIAMFNAVNCIDPKYRLMGCRQNHHQIHRKMRRWPRRLPMC